MFAKFDSDHDGSLSAHEFRSGLVTMGSGPEDAGKVVAAFGLDAANASELTYERFATAVKTWHKSQKGGDKRLPLYWLHIPKTGTSFINSIIRVPQVCPGLPKNLTVTQERFGRRLLDGLSQAYNVPEACPGLDDGFRGGHQGLGAPNAFGGNRMKGHLVTFMRKPEQRLISSYGDMLYSMKNNKANPFGFIDHRQPSRSWAWPYFRKPKSMLDYSQVVAGCVTRMLTRGDYPCGGPSLPTAQEQETAKRRLREDFAFIGLTEEWDLSICLFNSMFDVKCSASGAQFGNVRPHTNRDGSIHNASVEYKVDELQGFRDKHDGALYEEAQAIFDANLRHYNVTRESCQLCKGEAVAQ